MPAEGGKPERRIALTEGETLLGFDWSPDGKSLADVRVSGGYSSGTLEVRNLQDGEVRTLFSDPSLMGNGVLSWLSDGRVLFTLIKGNGNGNENDLWTISPDSSGTAGKPIRITNTTGLLVGNTSVSRDGKRMAVMLMRFPLSIFVANLDAKTHELEQPRRLTNDSWRNIPVA